MKKNLLILAPVVMLALAACNKTETPAADETAKVETPAAPIELPPSITASATYRCTDNTTLYVDFLGENIAADIRVGNKTATATRVSQAAAPASAAGEATAPATAPVAPSADIAPAGPLKSADGETSLLGSGKQINVKLAGKGAQTCKS